MKRLIFLFSLTCAVAVSALFGQAKSRPFFTSGYYHGIEMTSKESGDYGGISVYLTQSSNETFALVSFAEGVVLPPVLVPVKVSGKDQRTVEFIYKGEGRDTELKLKGTVRADGLMLSGHADKPQLLKRRCAQTWSNITAGSGGDLGGIEVYITDNDAQWYALVTIAEGELRAPVLVPAKATGKDFDRIEFSLPGGRKFTGTGRMTRTLTLTESGQKSVLKQKCYQ